MIKSGFHTAAAVIICMACSCHNGGKSSVNQADSANASKIDSGAVSLSTDETEFMVAAANDGMTEIQLGQVAQKKIKNARIGSFASMIISDHTQAGNELKALAGNKNVTLPDSLSASSRKDVDKLSRKSGAAFEKDYLDMMVSAHQKAVSSFQDELGKVQNADLRQWITNTLPVLQTHLDSARVLDSVYANSRQGKPYPSVP